MHDDPKPYPEEWCNYEGDGDLPEGIFSALVGLTKNLERHLRQSEVIEQLKRDCGVS